MFVWYAAFFTFHFFFFIQDLGGRADDVGKKRCGFNVAVVSSNVIGGKINQMISSKQGRRELVSCHFYF